MQQEKTPVPPAQFQEGAIATIDVAGLKGILTAKDSSTFQKAKACQRAGELGARELVPELAALLDDEHLSTYARYGLEPIADASADEALRSAMGKLKGIRQAGVINSIAKRRDAKAVPALARLMYGADPEAARAATSALGHIGDAAALRELQAALAKTKGPMRSTVGDACLICAERLIADGKRDQGLALYATLSAPDVPKPVRLAAMAGVIREETTLTRPR